MICFVRTLLSFRVVWQLNDLHLSKFLSSLLLPYLSLCWSLSHSPSLSVVLFFQRNILHVFVVPSSAKITRSHSSRRPCQEDDTVFTVCMFVGESMLLCLSPCVLCTSFCVMKCVCAFIFTVVLPFPSLGMFKASSCAVRMCLSLFSKNTCSAFYQRAVLGRPSAVQGWARIIKHQQILILPDWNWLVLFAWLVWLGLAGHGGITVLECGGLVLLRDWRLFVVRLNWS